MACPRFGQSEFRSEMGAQGSDLGDISFCWRRLFAKPGSRHDPPDRVVASEVGAGMKASRAVQFPLMYCQCAATCRSHAARMPLRCRSNAAHLPLTCRSCAAHAPPCAAMRRNMSLMCRSCAARMSLGGRWGVARNVCRNEPDRSSSETRTSVSVRKVCHGFRSISTPVGPPCHAVRHFGVRLPLTGRLGRVTWRAPGKGQERGMIRAQRR